DRQVNDFGDAPSRSTDYLATQSMIGREDLSKSTTDYYAARRGGMPDKDTQEHLPPKPELTDSAANGAAAVGRVEMLTEGDKGLESDKRKKLDEEITKLRNELKPDQVELADKLEDAIKNNNIPKIKTLTECTDARAFKNTFELLNLQVTRDISICTLGYGFLEQENTGKLAVFSQEKNRMALPI